jgi:hypothetical protein
MLDAPTEYIKPDTRESSQKSVDGWNKTADYADYIKKTQEFTANMLDPYATDPEDELLALENSEEVAQWKGYLDEWKDKKAEVDATMTERRTIHDAYADKVKDFVDGKSLNMPLNLYPNPTRKNEIVNISWEDDLKYFLIATLYKKKDVSEVFSVWSWNATESKYGNGSNKPLSFWDWQELHEKNNNQPSQQLNMQWDQVMTVTNRKVFYPDLSSNLDPEHVYSYNGMSFNKNLIDNMKFDRVQVFDMGGRLVDDTQSVFSLENNSLQIVAPETSGAYIIKIYDKSTGLSIDKKLIVQ